MRGKVGGDCMGTGNVRITPAYAGKSSISCPTSCVQQDHPRLCGEKIFLDALVIGYLGSPPPMRGKDEMPMYSIAFFRITPAYAGKS